MTVATSSQSTALYRFYRWSLDLAGVQITPERFPEERDRVQAGIVFAFQLAYVLTWATYVILYSLLGCPISAAFCAFVGIGPSLVGIAAFRRGHSPMVAGILSNVGSATALCLITSTTGGATSAVLVWMIAVLVGSFLQLGKRGGFGLTAYIVTLYVGIGVWGYLGMPQPYELPFPQDSRLFLAFNIYNFAFAAIIAAVIIGIFVTHIEQGYHFQRESEYQTRLAEELKNRMIQSERMAAIGTLAAGVAHEVNNPLAILYAHVGLLTRKLRSGTVDPDIPDIITKLRASMQRITTIVQGLLTYAKPDSADIQPIDPERAITDALMFLDPLIRRDEIRFTRRPSDTRPLAIANSSRLQQVLINLGTNACDALRFKATAREMGIDVTATDQHVLIAVWDNGPGIPADIQSKIFDPFFTTKPVGGGTGLGLSVSRSIVESFGGTLTIQSAPGQGCRAVVNLNRAPDASPPNGETP